jgi:DNA-directed RNA polymerase subunit H (RpoH/RPB5)
MAYKISTNLILSLYKSKTTLLELLQMENYDVADYEGFSISEIESMFKNSQLDMLVSKNKGKTDEAKLYVKYYLGKTLRNSLNDIVEDLFVLGNADNGDQPTLSKSDTLVIVTDDEPNATIEKNVRYKNDNEGIFIVIFNIKRLQFNVRKHRLNPEIRVMTDAEVEELKTRIKINSITQLPEISRFDPLAMSIFMRPNQVCHIVRDCPTAVREDYYRYCV